MSSLRDDILPNIPAIAEHIYGTATPSNIRRVRHLIDRHDFPVKRLGAKVESRKSWVDALYAEPDAPRNGR